MKKSILNKLLFWCVSLLIIRIIHNQNLGFSFLAWNLFLAWIPYAILQVITDNTTKFHKWLIIGIAFVFLPNSPYIMTDLFHLKENLAAPIWFDVVMLLSFTLCGMLYFLLAFEQILMEIKNEIPNTKLHEFIKFVALTLCAYGIYLGRYLRFNSWDIVTDPLNLLTKIIQSLTNYHDLTAIFVTLFYGLFLYLLVALYEGFKSGKYIQTNDQIMSD